MSDHCLGELILGLGQLALAILGFLVIVKMIEWPEKAIRWVIRWYSGRFRRTPPAPPRQHDDFDDAL